MDRRQGEKTIVRCVECGSSGAAHWQGWRAYRIDDSDAANSPSLAFTCPSCAYDKFGLRPRTARRGA